MCTYFSQKKFNFTPFPRVNKWKDIAIVSFRCKHK